MRRIALTLAPLLLLACDRAPVAPDGGPNVDPTFNIANAPLESGIVVRGGWPVGALMRDPETQLGLALGIGAVEYCSGTPIYYLQTWADKELADRIVTNAQGTDVPTEVWDAPPGNWNCAAIMAGEPLAAGVSHVIATNNDLYNSGEMNRVVHWRAHGILTRQNGDKAVARWQWRWNENQGGLTELSITLH
jgi:hypothetical protein